MFIVALLKRSVHPSINTLEQAQAQERGYLAASDVALDICGSGSVARNPQLEPENAGLNS